MKTMTLHQLMKGTVHMICFCDENESEIYFSVPAREIPKKRQVVTTFWIALFHHNQMPKMITML